LKTVADSEREKELRGECNSNSRRSDLLRKSLSLKKIR
jgi:hypothetical protein